MQSWAHTSKIVALAFLGLAAAACGKPSGHKSTGLPAYVLNGDPVLLLTGSVPDTKSPFKTAEVAKWKNFFLSSGAEFLSQTKNAGTKSQGQIENENSTTTEDSGSVFFEFVQKGDVWSYQPTTGIKPFSLQFKDNAGVLELQSIDSQAVTVLHYSISKAGDAFSLLVKTNAGTADESLLVVYFVTGAQTGTAPANIDAKFTTLLGDGVTVRWEEDMNVTICGNPSDAVEKQLETNIKQWLVNNTIGVRKMTVTNNKFAPPFSDLNTNCVMAVPDYIIDESTEYSTLGVTIPIVNNVQTILGSDVFIFEKPHERYFGDDNTTRTSYENATIMHEFGHFLGLGHPFKKDANGNPLYPSIMGYDQILQIQSYDRQGIAALYDGR